jgi:hypothetical protein
MDPDLLIPCRSDGAIVRNVERLCLLCWRHEQYRREHQCTVDNGQYYIVTVANFGSEAFTNWSDNSGSIYAWRGSYLVTVSNGNAGTTTNLTAVFSP